MMQSVDELLGQLRGVTGPEPAPPPEPFPWLPWLVAVLAVAAVAGIWWRMRRPKPLLPPDVEALNQIAKLPGTPTDKLLMQLDQIARRYLERQHQLPARMLTPAEFNDQIGDDWRGLLHSIQIHRFAPAQSAPDAWSGLVRQLESLIHDDCTKAAEEASCVKSQSSGDRL